MGLFPLAIAVNSEKASLSSEIMEVISAKKPGIRWLGSGGMSNEQLVDGSNLKRVSTRTVQVNRDRTPDPAGHVQLERGAGATDDCSWTYVPRWRHFQSVGRKRGERLVTTRWYRGEEQMDPVVEIPPRWDRYSYHEYMDRYPWRSAVIEHTRVWPWSITQETLSSSTFRTIEVLHICARQLDNPH